VNTALVFALIYFIINLELLLFISYFYN